MGSMDAIPYKGQHEGEHAYSRRLVTQAMKFHVTHKESGSHRSITMSARDGDGAIGRSNESFQTLMPSS